MEYFSKTCLFSLITSFLVVTSTLLADSSLLISEVNHSLSNLDHPYLVKNSGVFSVTPSDTTLKTDQFVIEPLPSRDLVGGTIALAGLSLLDTYPLSLSNDEVNEMNLLLSKHYDCCGSCCVDCCCVEMEEEALAYGGGYGGGGGGGYGGGYGGAGAAIGFSGGGGGVGVGTGSTTGETTSTTTGTTTGTNTTGTTTGTNTSVVVPEPSTWLIMAGMVALVVYLKARRNRFGQDIEKK